MMKFRHRIRKEQEFFGRRAFCQKNRQPLLARCASIWGGILSILQQSFSIEVTVCRSVASWFWGSETQQFDVTTWFLIENPGKYGKNPNVGPGDLFIVNVIKRIAQKLRIIIVLRFWLLTVRFHFGKTRKHFMFMVFWPSGHDHDSRNQHYLSLETPGHSA